MHLEINRRYGGHGGQDTEWEVSTRSMEVAARMKKLESFEDGRFNQFLHYIDEGGSSCFNILKDKGDKFAFYVFQWLTAWEEQVWNPPPEVDEVIPLSRAHTAKPKEFDFEFLNGLLNENTKWHYGDRELVDDDWNEGLDPDKNLHLPKHYQDINTGAPDCPIRLFINAEGKVISAWVGWGGIDDCWNAEHAAGIIAEEMAANDDGFGVGPDWFHPVLRDLIMKELEGYSRPWLS